MPVRAEVNSIWQHNLCNSSLVLYGGACAQQFLLLLTPILALFPKVYSSIFIFSPFTCFPSTLLLLLLHFAQFCTFCTLVHFSMAFCLISA